MNTQEAIQIVSGVVDAAVQSGVFKTAVHAGRAALAVQTIADQLEQIPQLEARIKELEAQQEPAPGLNS